MTTKTNPNREKKANVTARLPAVKRMLVNTETSSIGWSMRRSQATKPASSRAATAKAAMLVGDVQPWTGPSMTAHTSTPMPAIEAKVPTGSKRLIVVSREVGTTRATAIRATAITGTLMNRTDPHQKCSSSQPPVTGPRATAAPAVAAHTAIAAARSAER